MITTIISEHSSPHIAVDFPPLGVKTFKIYSVSNFQIYYTVLLTIVHYISRTNLS